VLDDDAIARYARQIVVPGIGAAGQGKLFASAALVLGNGRGCEQAALYLTAAGVRVFVKPQDLPAATTIDVAIACDATALDDAAHASLLGWNAPVCWYVLDRGGFTSGVHPDAQLPAAAPRTLDGATDALHDAAACDVAAVACAILVGLPWRPGLFHFEI
jgi:hypothetical protein